MNYLSFLLFFVAVIGCVGLTGCGATPVQVPLQIEQKLVPITFINDHCEALEIARIEGKPTLILFSVPDNVSSQRMMETTFCDEEVKRLAERFICVHVDASVASDLCKQLEIANFPTILLSNTNGTEIRRLIGKQTSDQLAVQMHVVLQTTALRPTSVR